MIVNQPERLKFRQHAGRIRLLRKANASLSSQDAHLSRQKSDASEGSSSGIVWRHGTSLFREIPPTQALPLGEGNRVR